MVLNLPERTERKRGELENSLITVGRESLISEESKMGLMAKSDSWGVFDLSMVPYMVFGGVAGGFLGDYFSEKMSEKHVEKLFNITMVVIILINIYNIIRGLF